MTSGQQQLGAWRQRMGLSLRGAADLLHVHWTYLGQLLSTNYRHRSPSLQTALRIKQVTGIPVDAWVPTPVEPLKRATKRTRKSVNVGKSQRRVCAG